MDTIETNALLIAHRQVHHALLETEYHHGTSPSGYIREYLDVIEGLKTNDVAEIPLPLPRSIHRSLPKHLLELFIMFYRRGLKAEVVCDYKRPSDRDDEQHSLNLFIRVERDESLQPTYWAYGLDDGLTVLKKIDHGSEHVEDYEALWLLIDRFGNKLDDIMATYELVRDLSEGALFCSYNEDDIRQMWLDGTLNEYIKNLDHLELERFKSQLGSNFCEDGDYEALLTKRIATINGWPTQWSYGPNDLDPLTIPERLKVLPLLLETQGSLERALNQYCDLKAELEKRL
ncbi:hypothetical protein LUCX_140 [Xanthomonas phage vB_XciM_LucasX]|nr:hypothetical protein LUCX_140 [Xanthomonas phage vB_XciM_LucasX]